MFHLTIKSYITFRIGKNMGNGCKSIIWDIAPDAPSIAFDPTLTAAEV
jgi:hypothetical protein